ncbi:type I-A CRISPR-associated protein Csa5 [Candidatus Aerophobetes bacterium]|nr:type I-A CRISPR-associated protein Csa5 [Candidatus Aerophobetes bacterium]
MITLFTPATGFPDLEAKIAYGLARVGIEAGVEVEILPREGFYQINFINLTGSPSKINQTFVLLSERLLSSSRFYDLGIKARFKSIYPAVDEKGNFKERLKKIDILSLYKPFNKLSFDFKSDKFCGHKKIPKFGSPYDKEIHSGGLILLASTHAGKPYWRDNRKNEFNLTLCEVCGYLATLGYTSFNFRIQIGKGNNRKYIIVLPVPQKSLKNPDLLTLFASQKTLHNFWLSDIIPLSDFTIGLLSKVPTLSEFIEEIPLSFHLSLVSKDNRGDTIVEQSAFIDTFMYSKFINASSYNAEMIEKLLRGSPKIKSLDAINKVLLSKDRIELMKFARLFIQETSSDNFVNLLYPETSNYLLREVAMIRSEIIEDKAISSVAHTLRYFISKKKYHYADDIRNARKDSRDFEDTIAKMLREGRLRLEQEKYIHLPNESEIRKLFELANENFDEVKTALVILALSFPTKKEEVQDA